MKRILITGSALSEKHIFALKGLGFHVINGTIAALETIGIPADERGRELTEEEMCVLIKDISIYIYGGLEAASSNVIKAATHLNLITFMGTGWSDPGCVDADAAKECNITITNTPHANAPSVAEITIGLLLSLERCIVSMNNATKIGNGMPVMRNDISGKTLGIIGLGHIGGQVGHYAVNGFGMKLKYYSPNRKQQLETSLGAQYVDLQTLLATSDYITIHSPANSTCGMIGSKDIDLIQKHALLLNLSAPEIVDGEALVSALETDKIRGAAFDGFYREPKSLMERFLSIPDDKLIVLPRSAWLTSDSYTRMGDMVLQSINDFVNGQNKLSYQVS